MQEARGVCGGGGRDGVIGSVTIEFPIAFPKCN